LSAGDRGHPEKDCNKGDGCEGQSTSDYSPKVTASANRPGDNADLATSSHHSP
jgi:hypothetical protein